MLSTINLDNHLKIIFGKLDFFKILNSKNIDILIFSTFQTFLGIDIKLMMNLIFSSLVNAIETVSSSLRVLAISCSIFNKK